MDSRNEYMKCPEPTYTFKVGDLVSYGNIDRTEILEVLDDGKFYRCKINHMNKRPGGPVAEERVDVLSWLQIRPLLAEQPPVLAEDVDIRLNYSQRDISGLLLAYYQFGIDMDPVYQRGNVWSLEDKVKLIDSIYHNVDIGKFVLVNRPFKDVDTATYEMLDGKQRLTAIAEFYENKFPYKGLTYNQLSYSDKYHFRYYGVSWAELNNCSLSQKLRAFIKLNTTGHVVDPKHMAMVEGMLKKETPND